ncbi:hypothetical protein IEQ34_003440 [Dendrobium chrysotoxum]|uniref:Uncharacterized protein n=1 Tax=Dendrobium chrysotoxum TaxID=161865 RepID=A0AAV7HKN0_DENCH|nr:hypothetical protein IEQ34_003440 [Dendrobium chrysotoxum]
MSLDKNLSSNIMVAIKITCNLKRGSEHELHKKEREDPLGRTDLEVRPQSWPSKEGEHEEIAEDILLASISCLQPPQHPWVVLMLNQKQSTTHCRKWKLESKHPVCSQSKRVISLKAINMWQTAFKAWKLGEYGWVRHPKSHHGWAKPTHAEHGHPTKTLCRALLRI